MLQTMMKWLRTVDFWAIVDGEAKCVRIASLSIRGNRGVHVNVVKEEDHVDNYDRWVEPQELFLYEKDCRAELVKREEARHQEELEKIDPVPEPEKS